MTEQSKPPSIDLSELDKIPDNLEMPPYHVLREGEPPKPEFPTHYEVIWQPEIALTKHKLDKAYQDWMEKQPDYRLLNAEYWWLKIGHGVAKRGGLDKFEIYTAWDDYRKVANKLRKEGQGEIIDRYWPFLRDSLNVS